MALHRFKAIILEAADAYFQNDPHLSLPHLALTLALHLLYLTLPLLPLPHLAVVIPLALHPPPLQQLPSHLLCSLTN